MAQPERRDHLMTGEELFRRADLGPCELIDGKVVAVSPTGDEHGGVEVNIATALATFVRSRRLGHVRVGEVGIYTRRNPDRVRAADVLFISRERYARRTIGLGYLDVAPELVVEILSPRDTAADFIEKLHEYFHIGVVLVWVIDPATHRVLVYRAPTVAHDVGQTESLLGEDVLPGFVISVAALFDI